MAEHRRHQGRTPRHRGRGRPSGAAPDGGAVAAEPGRLLATAAEHWPADCGIVAGVSRNRCLVLLGGQAVSCALAPELRHQGLSLAVGDRVALEASGSESRVTAILPRRSELVRQREDRSRRLAAGQGRQVLAANVDLAVVVAAKRKPPFHPRLLDRYLVMCRAGGVDPLICLNKADLPGPDPDLGLYEGLGVPSVLASAATGLGLQELRQHLRGRTGVLVGHSGVGKSSLLNALLGEEAAVVGELGREGRRGRHTTTASSLHDLGEGSWLIDSPGIRSWGLSEIDRESLRDYFPEFAELAPACRYRDCNHTVEPDCAVLAAVEAGEIPRARYDSYRRLYEEAES
ncbi:MAG: ribosome small subunit-dependent GTPase A [Tistlia sp.]|uniref:ribosome small subunit-dependent GTPase A n=1 Tax=Tistlia sp. TaxID=3057121 RepID=UPI0034A329D1